MPSLRALCPRHGFGVSHIRLASLLLERADGGGVLAVVAARVVTATATVILVVVALSVVVAVVEVIMIAVAASISRRILVSRTIGVAATLASIPVALALEGACVLTLSALKDALAAAGEMLGVTRGDVNHLGDFGKEGVGDGAIGLHVPEEVLCSVAQEADIAKLVVASVGNARLVRVTVVEVRLGFLVDAGQLLQGGLGLGGALIDNGLELALSAFKVLEIGKGYALLVWR